MPLWIHTGAHHRTGYRRKKKNLAAIGSGLHSRALGRQLSGPAQSSANLADALQGGNSAR
jgi:hypothetical protein